MSNFLLGGVYAKVAKELGLTKYQVEDAFKSQFDLVTKTMADKTNYTGVRVPRLGTFYVKPGRVEYLKQKQNSEENEREQQQASQEE